MITVRKARLEEYEPVGQLMVNAYRALEGFPSPAEMPGYYDTLADIGAFSTLPEAEILVAVDDEDQLAGAVVYFGAMAYYGTSSTATHELRACGFRFLAVDAAFQNQGIGRLLVDACIAKAKQTGKEQLIIHTTVFMKSAQHLYEKLGFTRHEPFDFWPGDFPVWGLVLDTRHPG